MQRDGASALPRTPCTSTLVDVPEIPWRERVEVESRLQRELLASLSASARRRAEAFEEGVRELGSKSAVAREVGITVSAVRRSIREYGTATATPDDSTTE